MHSLRSRQVHFFVAVGLHNWDGGNVGTAAKRGAGSRHRNHGFGWHVTISGTAHSIIESLTDPITQYISPYADRVIEGEKHVELS